MSAKPDRPSPLAGTHSLRPISFGNPEMTVERRADGTIYLRPRPTFANPKPERSSSMPTTSFDKETNSETGDEAEQAIPFMRATRSLTLSKSTKGCAGGF